MWAYQAYEAAVLYTQNQVVQDPSVINSSLISATRGEYGNFHLTSKTRGSQLNISPIMSLYWFFKLMTVAEHNLFLPLIGHTQTFMEVVQIYVTASRTINKRRTNKIFQP